MHLSPVKALLVVLIVAGMGLAAFFVSRYALSDSGGVEAQLRSDIPEKVQADKALPKFEGSLNGFTFYDPDKQPVSRPPQCDGLTGGEDALPQELSASALNFTTGYLPPGAGKIFEGGNKCRGVVVAVIRNFGVNGGAQVAIARIGAPPNITADAPLTRLESATVGGRPAVIVKPIFEGDRAAVYMRDASSYWMVSGAHTSLAEVIKVAEGVK